MVFMALLLVATLTVGGGSRVCDDVPNRSIREQLLQQPELGEAGARFLTIHGNTILVSVAEVPVPSDQRADRAFADASTLATIEARAKAALFLDGQYSVHREAGQDRTVNPREEEQQRTWIKSHVVSLARVKLANGETVELRRREGCVRAVVAWGLPPTVVPNGPQAAEWVATLADVAMANDDLPALDLSWVTGPDGREGLLVRVAIHPDVPLGAPTHSPELRSTCPCRPCRERVLQSKALALAAGWVTEGDLAVAKRLSRHVTQLRTISTKGHEALERLTSRTASKTTTHSTSAVLPGDMLSEWIHQERHADARSVCVGFIPSMPKPGEQTPIGQSKSP
jgi:hypothetical protein